RVACRSCTRAQAPQSLRRPGRRSRWSGTLARASHGCGVRREPAMREDQSKARVHVAVYDDIPQADRAVWQLVQAGIPEECITVICPTCTAEKYPGLHREQPAGSHAAVGATAGGAIGALLGGLAAVIGITASGGTGLLAAGSLLFTSGSGAVFGG